MSEDNARRIQAGVWIIKNIANKRTKKREDYLINSES